MADSDRIEGAVKSALEKTENAAGQMKDRLKDTAESISDAGSDAYDRGAELVEQSPGSALLIAGLVGFALGVLFTRGSQPRRNSLQRYYDQYGR